MYFPGDMEKTRLIRLAISFPTSYIGTCPKMISPKSLGGVSPLLG